MTRRTPLCPTAAPRPTPGYPSSGVPLCPIVESPVLDEPTTHQTDAQAPAHEGASGCHPRPPSCQGSRFTNALPLPKSIGTETWSCAMTQLPSIFRKPAVYRTQGPILSPFSNVPLNRLKLCPNATSLPTVIVRSRTS